MLQNTRITDLFRIKYPIVQAGMVWCSGWKLASAVSNAGGLGIIGAGSMHPEVLKVHIQKCKKATDKPFAVNLPLLYPEIDKHVSSIIEAEVPIVFTSAGSPKKWTSKFKAHGITVVHVVSSALFAKKSEDAGVDAVVAEGFEAGGHNGREETTTLCLIPKVREVVRIPVIAAGGIYSGRTMLASMILGADGVQIGSRFATALESSAHQNFKERVVQLNEGETQLRLKQLAPVRLIKNSFFDQVKEAEMAGVSTDEIRELLGKGRSKKGIFEGDLVEGELEIGQVSALIEEIEPAHQIVKGIWDEFCELNGKSI